MPRCSGNTADHCCYVDGGVCRFLEENTVAGRRWVCGLLRQLGSWKAVHESAEYQKHVQPMWDRLGGDSCGDYPGPGRTCATCGIKGKSKWLTWAPWR